jgi:hypothetical protein
MDVWSLSGVARWSTGHDSVDGEEQMRILGAATVKGSLRVVCLAMITTLGAVEAMATEEAD